MFSLYRIWVEQVSLYFAPVYIWLYRQYSVKLYFALVYIWLYRQYSVKLYFAPVYIWLYRQYSVKLYLVYLNFQNSIRNMYRLIDRVLIKKT